MSDARGKHQKTFREKKNVKKKLFLHNPAVIKGMLLNKKVFTKKNTSRSLHLMIIFNVDVNIRTFKCYTVRHFIRRKCITRLI